MSDKPTDNKDRFHKACQIAESNAEKLFVEAAEAGDVKTVRYMLDRDLNLSDSQARSSDYIAFPPKAYQHAFCAAAKSLHDDVIMELLDHVADQIEWSYLAHTAHKALNADPKLHPGAAFIIENILMERPDALPYPILEVAKRFTEGDEAQKDKIRQKLDDYISFYENKQFYTERAEDRAKYPKKLSPLKHDKPDAEKKDRPSYLRPVN